MESQSTRKVFIQRDYTFGTAVRFTNELPRELQGKVDANTFETTMDTINSMFDSAEALSCRNISEGCLSCITGYTIHYCFKTNYEQCVDKVAKYIQQQNRDVYEPKGITIGDPMDRGLRCIEVIISKQMESHT